MTSNILIRAIRITIKYLDRYFTAARASDVHKRQVALNYETSVVLLAYIVTSIKWTNPFVIFLKYNFKNVRNVSSWYH